jgi:hypothetical protein
VNNFGIMAGMQHIEPTLFAVAGKTSQTMFTVIGIFKIYQCKWIFRWNVYCWERLKKFKAKYN